jgi:hypothetical protein
MKDKEPGNCRECGAAFKKHRPQHTFCNSKCRSQYFWKTLKQKAAYADNILSANVSKKVAPPKPTASKPDLFSDVAA